MGLISRETRQFLKVQLAEAPDISEGELEFWRRHQQGPAHYHPLSREFDRLTREHLELDQTHQSELLADVGCGRAVLLRQMHDDGHTVQGVDVARHPELPPALFKQGLLTTLPLESGSVGKLWSHAALPYTNMEKAAAEIHRVLKPGGRAFIVVHHPDMLHERLQLMAAQFGFPPHNLDGFFRMLAPALARQPNDLARLVANAFEDLDEGKAFFTAQGFRIIKSKEMRDKSLPKNPGLAYWYLLEKSEKNK